MSRGRSGRGPNLSAPEYRVEAGDFTRLLKETKAFDAALGRELRKGIRVAAKVAADASKREVLKAPHSGGRGRSRGLRRAIAAGIRVQVHTGKKAEGVVIRSGTSQVAALTGNSAIPALYDGRGRWRHPVFGNTDVWVQQYGRPYFGSVIAKHRPQVEAAVLDAMEKATEALSRA